MTRSRKRRVQRSRSASACLARRDTTSRGSQRSPAGRRLGGRRTRKRRMISLRDGQCIALPSRCGACILRPLCILASCVRIARACARTCYLQRDHAAMPLRAFASDLERVKLHTINNLRRCGGDRRDGVVGTVFRCIYTGLLSHKNRLVHSICRPRRSQRLPARSQSLWLRTRIRYRRSPTAAPAPAQRVGALHRSAARRRTILHLTVRSRPNRVRW